MMAMSQIVLDQYDHKYKLELDDYLVHLIVMMQSVEKNFRKENKHIIDPGITRHGKVPDIHLERSINRQRIIRYMKWYRKKQIAKYWNENKN